jgi:hypothetical protein
LVKDNYETIRKRRIKCIICKNKFSTFIKTINMNTFNRGSNLNQSYLPNGNEIVFLSKLQHLIRSDFRLIRLTKTMIEKSTIDASGQIRELFKDNNIVDYSEIPKGPNHKKLINNGILLSGNEVIETKISYYRPNTKDGDPRFWVYGARKHVDIGTLLMITIQNEKVVFIPVNNDESILHLTSQHFSSNDIEEHITYFKSLYSIHNGSWIESCSPFKSSPKDVGETLESLLGLDANSSRKADLNDVIEIKSKRKGSGTKSSLFSMVPNWKNSPVNSSKSMILNYGYHSDAHPGYKDLYVTVSGKPNNQGLFLQNDHDENILTQMHINDGITCLWNHEDVKNRLWEKHPNTIWVDAEEKIIDGKIHFRYNNTMKFTSNPIFSQFLTLVDTNLITFDWRGKVKPDGTKYRDHGHGFRIGPKNRNLLFSDHVEFKI